METRSGLHTSCVPYDTNVRMEEYTEIPKEPLILQLMGIEFMVLFLLLSDYQKGKHGRKNVPFTNQSSP
jgi:hypothetical protein